MLKGDTDKGSWENYLDHIGLFFIFTACAGISIWYKHYSMDF